MSEYESLKEGIENILNDKIKPDSVTPIKSIKKINSLSAIKSIQAVKSMTPIKSIKEVKNIYYLTEEQAKMLKVQIALNKANQETNFNTILNLHNL